MEIKQPKLDPSVFVADGAHVLGDVSAGENASIWYGAVIRGDENSITIGKETNIQDNAVLHASPGFPEVIGDGVTIGHGAIVHGSTVGDNSLIGMGAVILNGAKIGADCVIGAGALITQGKEIPDGHLAMGSPAKVVRALTEEEIAHNRKNCEVYLELAESYRNRKETS